MATTTARRLERSADQLSTAAIARLESSYEWYRRLPADERSWVGLVAQAGINAFITWYRDPQASPPMPIDVFATAPRELTRSIALQQTLQMVRTAIDVVEERVPQLAAAGDEHQLREAVLTYSREIAFAAAHVYAQAAESRGAWDARLEALVVDAVMRAEADEALRSRVAALGWDEVRGVIVIAGAAPPGPGTGTLDTLRRNAIHEGLVALGSVQRNLLIAILGGVDDGLAVAARFQHLWGEGAVVVGPQVPHLYAAGRSARAAMSGVASAPAWPQAPRPCPASELLPERALTGDTRARRALVDKVTRPLRERSALRDTVAAYLDEGSLESTARVLFVHPNTVRYRLGRIAELTGFDLTDQRDAFTVRLALALSRI
ncbi:PucR family transcriptional regulator [Flexivirga endophytica]|uniref:PucR family transcriptional regulator n=1 Tax=Flexivirga endophytica TaxID=1849103 RepID=A0A916TDU5_9MICO|nr:helix-turn-helix domain-containing protein [Flexivirga endophytica]GGB41584.1 PucR family transcriptional regulator [Flexivirga endophytica]GHB49417.1 PucR family transcriptional regulator [Flexivirga endophytica]